MLLPRFSVTLVSFKAEFINLFLNVREGFLEFDAFFNNMFKELLSIQDQKEILWQCSLVGNLFKSEINLVFFLVKNMGSNSLLLEQYIIWEVAAQVSCKLRVFIPVSSD